MRVGRGLRVAGTCAEASRWQAGETTGAQAPVCLRGAGPDGAFEALGVSLEPDALLDRELHLMLPSFDEGPQHSPQLLRGDEQGRRPQ